MERQAQALSAELRSLSSTVVDPSPIIMTALPFYGVSLGDLRSLARRWHRRYPEANPGDVAALADALWSRGVREEMVLAALLHGHDRKAREGFGLRTVDRWVRSIDNWETADAVGASLLAPWVADDPERGYRTLDLLSRRRNPWARRLALVGCLGTGRTSEAARWWPRVESLVLRASGDREGGIPKAVSWVLRVHTARCPDRVAALLARHAPVLPAIAVRETRNKLETGTKSGKRSG